MNKYNQLRYISEVKEMPLKETIREALLKYIKRHEKHVMKDSLFSIVGSFSTEKVTGVKGMNGETESGFYF
ncbi:MAG: hypothetical protein OIN89_06700 [Candidatus Methanoperedens sp.]|jgi:hypothetical protein|nr:hypothetical protein [Candidatus Methanoperedens sp.]PKL53690.1 MAG: hypothetical protein CVV36_05765 [Candidatus Methanoperedenaceae archaeon HGW-Methanoperedenaceae-1]